MRKKYVLSENMTKMSNFMHIYTLTGYVVRVYTVMYGAHTIASTIDFVLNDITNTIKPVIR